MSTKKDMRVMVVGPVTVVAAGLLLSGCERRAVVPEDTAPQPVIEEVDSATFSQIGYDPVEQTLTVVFREGGSTYVYRGVEPNVYEEFIAAPSLGSFYTSRIRDAYAYERR